MNGRPSIDRIDPSASLPGGEIRIVGKGLGSPGYHQPQVSIESAQAGIVISAGEFLVARVPEGAASGRLVVAIDENTSNAVEVNVAVPMAENLHPVANPALDPEGNVYATVSGSRGQKVPVAIFKIDTDFNMEPFVLEMMNATGIAFDREGLMYVSSRFDGAVYRVSANGSISSYAQGLGVATGLAFDGDGNLYVGDRSGTIFKIGSDRQIFVFATLEPSVSAYHLAFGPDGNLYVTGPTTSSYDCVYCISPQGEVATFHRGLGRPQGIAFDNEGNLYVAASLTGRRGIVKLTPQSEPSLAISGQNLVGLAFAPGRTVVLATGSAVYHLTWTVEGRPLIPNL